MLLTPSWWWTLRNVASVALCALAWLMPSYCAVVLVMATRLLLTRPDAFSVRFLTGPPLVLFIPLVATMTA
jgi:hypothetical protein